MTEQLRAIHVDTMHFRHAIGIDRIHLSQGPSIPPGRLESIHCAARVRSKSLPVLEFRYGSFCSPSFPSASGDSIVLFLSTGGGWHLGPVPSPSIPSSCPMPLSPVHRDGPLSCFSAPHVDGAGRVGSTVTPQPSPVAWFFDHTSFAVEKVSLPGMVSPFEGGGAGDRAPSHHRCQAGGQSRSLFDRGGFTPVPPPIPLWALTPIRSYPLRKTASSDDSPDRARTPLRPTGATTERSQNLPMNPTSRHRFGGSQTIRWPFGEKANRTRRAQPRTRPRCHPFYRRGRIPRAGSIRASPRRAVPDRPEHGNVVGSSAVRRDTFRTSTTR